MQDIEVIAGRSRLLVGVIEEVDDDERRFHHIATVVLHLMQTSANHYQKHRAERFAICLTFKCTALSIDQLHAWLKTSIRRSEQGVSLYTTDGSNALGN